MTNPINPINPIDDLSDFSWFPYELEEPFDEIECYYGDFDHLLVLEPVQEYPISERKEPDPDEDEEDICPF
jgi:hypothetical protein